MKLIPGHYDPERTPVIWVDKGESFPSFGYPKEKCPCPSKYHFYAEWEGRLGHGWFCALCGKLTQVG